jgi:hypothetical protein
MAEYVQHSDGDLDADLISAGLTLRITYEHEPGSGPLYQRGEPLPVAPADPPEVRIQRVEAARERATYERDAGSNVRRLQAERLSGWVDVTPALNALLTAEDWARVEDRLLAHHDQAMPAALYREAAE